MFPPLNPEQIDISTEQELIHTLISVIQWMWDIYLYPRSSFRGNGQWMHTRHLWLVTLTSKNKIKAFVLIKKWWNLQQQTKTTAANCSTAKKTIAGKLLGTETSLVWQTTTAVLLFKFFFHCQYIDVPPSESRANRYFDWARADTYLNLSDSMNVRYLSVP